MIELVIQPKIEGKGRAFAATCIAHVRAESLWPAGNDATRPVFMSLVGTDNELRPFVANLRLGRKAEMGYRGREKFEVLKSAGFQCAWQRTTKGTRVDIFAPDLFALDPGMVDPAGVKFIILPAKSWLKPLDVPLPECVPAERAEAIRALAPLFIAYLDRRTRCPLVPDPRFYAQVLANALDQGLATFSTHDRSWAREWGAGDRGYREVDIDVAGFGPGLLFRASHETLETFLADQVRIFFAADEAAPSSRAA